MMSNLHAWLVAGSPAHFYLVLAAAYACVCWLLSKYPKARANTVLEVVFNTLNPKVLPLLKLIPVAGPLLAGFLDLFDSPKPAPQMSPAEALEEVNRARRSVGRVSVATMLWLAALIGLAGMFAACMGGCASGTDGLKQACANTDSLLAGGYKTASAGMKVAISTGKAKQLLGCFTDLIAGLDTVKGTADGVCEATVPKPTTQLIASVAQDGADVAAAIAKFQSCSAGVL